jgi:hypothetical protein
MKSSRGEQARLQTSGYRFAPVPAELTFTDHYKAISFWRDFKASERDVTLLEA